MKKNLKILGVETEKDGRPRVTKAGKSYSRVNTSDGWMSCFNEKATADLKNNIDKDVCVETTEAGDFKNITKYYGEPEDIDAKVIDEENEDDSEIEVQKFDYSSKTSSNAPRKSVKGSAYEKDPVGLAVDVFICLSNIDNNDGQEKPSPISDVIQQSITVVKDFQKAFEQNE